MASAVVVNLREADRHASGAVQEAEDPWGLLLVRIAASQDRDAFARLFGHFAPLIKSFALSNTGLASNALAEELVQEVMLKVWRRASTYSPDKASGTTWIYTLARNCRIDLLRRQQRQPLAVDADALWDLEADEDSGPGQSAERQHVAEQVQNSLAALPFDQRQVVSKVYMEGKTHSEVAAELSLPLGTVKSRIRLAMSKMKLMLDR